ncbi:MAG: alpha/beta hydrolase [Acidimicrobiales bacterium]|nr:alpha/beta hydrolase [Acidimicrobiales bacterium]
MALDADIVERVAHLHDATLAQLLSGEVEGVPPAPPLRRADVERHDRAIDGPGGPLAVRVYRPVDADGVLPALVWVHGGGWQYGDLDMPEADSVSQIVAATARIAVVSVGYRLAPVHRHPAALDDVVAAWRWVSSGAAPGIDPAHVGLGGASAGGLLAAAATLVLAGEEVPPAALWLAYPVTDPDGGPYDEPHADCPPVLWLGREGTMGLFGTYLGADPADAGPPIVPLAGDLAQLPPTLVTTAECDGLRAQGERFVGEARAQGVEVAHHHVDGVLHGYLNTVGDSGAADLALERHVRWVHAALAVGIPGENY